MVRWATPSPPPSDLFANVLFPLGHRTSVNRFMLTLTAFMFVQLWIIDIIQPSRLELPTPLRNAPTAGIQALYGSPYAPSLRSLHKAKGRMATPTGEG